MTSTAEDANLLGFLSLSAMIALPLFVFPYCACMFVCLWVNHNIRPAQWPWLVQPPSWSMTQLHTNRARRKEMICILGKSMRGEGDNLEGQFSCTRATKIERQSNSPRKVLAPTCLAIYEICWIICKLSVPFHSSNARHNIYWFHSSSKQRQMWKLLWAHTHTWVKNLRKTLNLSSCRTMFNLDSFWKH